MTCPLFPNEGSRDELTAIQFQDRVMCPAKVSSSKTQPPPHVQERYTIVYASDVLLKLVVYHCGNGYLIQRLRDSWVDVMLFS